MSAARAITLGEYLIENQEKFPYAKGELTSLLSAIRLAAKVVNREINKAGITDILGASSEDNVQGERQMKLDVYANEIFIQTLINREIVCRQDNLHLRGYRRSCINNRQWL